MFRRIFEKSSKCDKEDGKNCDEVSGKNCDEVDNVVYVLSVDLYEKNGWQCSSNKVVKCFTYSGKEIDCGILQDASYETLVFKCSKFH